MGAARRSKSQVAGRQSCLLASTALVGVALVATPALAAPNGSAQYWNGGTTPPNGMVNGGTGSWTNANTDWTNAGGTVSGAWASGTGIFAGRAGTVTVNDAITFQALEFSTSGYDVVAGTGSLTATGAGLITTDANVTVTIAAPIAGSVGLTTAGTGTLTFTGANTYTGQTQIDAGATLALAGSGAIFDTSGVVANGTLDISGETGRGALISALSGNGAVNLGGESLAIFGGGATFGGVIADGGLSGGAGGGLEIASGTQTLSGVNTYTGVTQIDPSATLALSGKGSIANSLYIADIGTLDISRTTAGATILGLFDSTGAGTVTLGTKTLTIANGVGTFFAGSISGSGGLTVASGSQQLAGSNTYTGTTTIGVAGELDLIGAGAITTSSGVAANGIFDISGANAGVSIKSLAGAGTGVVDLGANGLTITNANGSFAGIIQDGGQNGGTGGSLTIAGGSQTLAGANTYTGATIINSGTLEVDGSIASPTVDVNAGGTLSGTGAIGDPTIAAGGTLAPGNAANPYGTLTINGPLTFAAGSFYDVSITPTANSRTNVVGTATISGGTVQVAAGSGTYARDSRYAILNATNGVAGSFSGVTSNLAFLMPTLSYDFDNVVLDITGNAAGGSIDYRVAASTANQLAVASGLNTGAKFGGSSGPILTAFNQLTTPQAQAAFNAISGEGLAAAQNAAIRSTGLFTSSIFDQTTFYGDDGGTPNSISLTAPQPGFMAYAPSDGGTAGTFSRAPIRELADLPSRTFTPVPPPQPQRTWRAWATGFGGVDDVHGNAAVGSAAETDTLYGGTLGVDYRVNDNYLAGLAVGGSDAEFSVPGRATSGSVTGGHVAFYDLATFGAFYAATTTSASFYSNQTNRTTGGFGGIGNDTEHGSFQSHAYSTRLEVGRHVAAYGGLVTPFAALQLTELRSYGFTEQAVSGPGLLALNVQGQDSASVPSLLGLRFQYVMPLGNGLVLSPSLQVAWEHEFSPQRQIDANLVNLPTATFVVDGARPARDSAAVKAGAELAITSQASLFANFDGEFSGVDQFYAGKGGFKYVW